MKISTRGRYFLRLMIDLVKNYNDEFIALKDISSRQNISKKYLEQIVPFLNRSNLLISNRGHMGGYRLSNICPRQSHCVTLPIWKGLNEVIMNY